MTDSSQPQPSAAQRVVCPPAKDPAVRRFIVAAIFIGIGAWCLSDQRQPPAEWSLKNINAVAGYLMNNVGPYIVIPVGAIFAVMATLHLRRTLVADEEGIGYTTGQKVAWSEITKLDAAKLKTKGCLYLHHGPGKVLALDSYYLQNFHDLLALIEQKVPADRQILA